MEQRIAGTLAAAEKLHASRTVKKFQ